MSILYSEEKLCCFSAAQTLIAAHYHFSQQEHSDAFHTKIKLLKVSHFFVSL